jgi:hypothetical protein
MGLLNKLFGKAKEFASYTKVTNANGVQINPISETVATMNERPKYKSIDGFEYLKFGTADDTDLIIDRMSYKSATHSGIVTKKAKMITGIGVEALDENDMPIEDPKILALLKNAGGAGISLYDVLTRAGYEYVRTGAVGLLIDFDAPSKNKIPDGIIEIQAIPSRNMRFARPDDSGRYTDIIVRKSFKSGADVPPAQSYPIFNPYVPKAGKQIIYIKNPYSVLDSYGLPNWMGAYHFIEADYEFGLQIENAAKNGFAPKVHVTMTGRNMSEEERQIAANNIQNRLSGSAGDQVIVSFVGRIEEAPQIDSLNIENLDKTISVMAQLNDAKILTAHNVTSPTLFGVVTTSRMGGTGSEMTGAYELFKSTETEPDRKLILTSLNKAFEATELVDINLSIIDYDVTIDYKTKPVENGNTEEDPYKQDVTNEKTK